DLTRDESLGEIEVLQNAVFGDFNPDGTTLAFGTNEDIINNPIFILDMETQTVIKQLDGQSGFIRSLRYSPDARLIASGSSNGVIRVWDVQSGNIIHTLRGHNSRVDDLAYHPAGNLLASTSEDNTTRLWNLQTGDLLLTIPVQQFIAPEPLVSFTPDGHYLIVNDSRILQIWGIPQD
nr:hypothetical protein [Anaerolineae bacterium]